MRVFICDYLDNKLDSLIRKEEDPNWWRTVKDELNNTGVVLTDEQLNLLERIKEGKTAQPSSFDDVHCFYTKTL